MDKFCFMPICSFLFIWLTWMPVYADDFDWSSGNWGIKVTDSGAAGSPVSEVIYPGGKKSGNALEIYYRMTDVHIPQLWVFLTDGYWRQTSCGNPFGTSYHIFRYYSSSETSEYCDKTSAASFRVIGLTSENQMQIQLEYENNALSGDRFEISADVFLSAPECSVTSMNLAMTVKNITGNDVIPHWDGHRTLAEQWELFEISSMYVADNLTVEIPSWYKALDPDNGYVGITNDSDFMNDGFSKNGGIYVSTHDAKTIVAGDRTINLDHENCPFINIPDYSWYQQLVMLDQVSESIGIKHLYAPGRNHTVGLLSCSGMTENSQNLKWAVQYERNDTNLVDGDNVLVKLGMDDFLNVWPKDASQTIHLNLKTGEASLDEAIAILKLVAGLPVSADRTECVQDIDGDAKTGLAEAIHIMQFISDVRE